MNKPDVDIEYKYFMGGKHVASRFTSSVSNHNIGEYVRFSETLYKIISVSHQPTKQYSPTKLDVCIDVNVELVYRAPTIGGIPEERACIYYMCDDNCVSMVSISDGRYICNHIPMIRDLVEFKVPNTHEIRYYKVAGIELSEEIKTSNPPWRIIYIKVIQL